MRSNTCIVFFLLDNKWDVIQEVGFQNKNFFFS